MPFFFLIFVPLFFPFQTIMYFFTSNKRNDNLQVQEFRSLLDDHNQIIDTVQKQDKLLSELRLSLADSQKNWDQMSSDTRNSLRSLFRQFQALFRTKQDMEVWVFELFSIPSPPQSASALSHECWRHQRTLFFSFPFLFLLDYYNHPFCFHYINLSIHFLISCIFHEYLPFVVGIKISGGGQQDSADSHALLGDIISIAMEEEIDHMIKNVIFSSIVTFPFLSLSTCSGFLCLVLYRGTSIYCVSSMIVLEFWFIDM